MEPNSDHCHRKMKFLLWMNFLNWKRLNFVIKMQKSKMRKSKQILKGWILWSSEPKFYFFASVAHIGYRIVKEEEKGGRKGVGRKGCGWIRRGGKGCGWKIHSSKFVRIVSKFFACLWRIASKNWKWLRDS